jgi:PAS domain S-box-containing protein
MTWRPSSTAVGLAIGVTVAVSATFAVAAYFYSQHHFESLLDTSRETAVAQGELIRSALEHQMMENDRSLIGQMVLSFGRQPRVETVMLLDRNGVAQYWSADRPAAADLEIDSPTCQACHQYPPEQRGASRVIDTKGGTVLRTVIPVRNREACHQCHDPAHGVNGILILDLNVGEMRASMNRDLRWMIGGSGALTLLLIGAIAVVVRLVLLKRLQHFETTARQIAAGDLQRRVPVTGSDTISWLGREFNTMADSVTGLLGEVRSQRERLETVINSIDDGILVLDPQRKVIAANDGFLRRAGGVRELVVGCCCRDTSQGVCSAGDCPTLDCLQSGQRQVRICERRNPDGTVAWEEVHASPILDDAGRLIQVVEVWRDISDRRAAEARLAESHRLASLGMLASGFSHELNTPLSTVLMCVESICREKNEDGGAGPDWDRVAQNAAIARDQVLRCRGITQHFLRTSRGQTSPGDIVDLPAAVMGVTRLIEPTARSHGVKVDVGEVPDGVHVRADDAGLQHTLINLLLNAVQACSRGGTVAIHTEVGPQVRIRVSDNGCGIAPEHQRRIFEPFVSMRQGGTGLGLFLSLNFVRQWGGDITIDSTPGVGSTFELVLPALAGQAGRST